jgi:hypothetical protein
MTPDELRKLVEDDDLELLKVKPLGSGALTVDQRILESFKEIEEFVRLEGREPRPDPAHMREFKLNSRLAGIRASKTKSESLRPVDSLGLLGKAVESIEDAVADDDMGLLDGVEDSIFNLKHVPTQINRPDKIAQRIPCEDFDRFEPLFEQCHAEVASGVRESRPFTGAADLGGSLLYR